MNFSNNRISPDDVDIIAKQMEDKVKKILQFQNDPIQLGAKYDWRNQLGAEVKKTEEVNLNVVESVGDLVDGKIQKICLTQLDLSKNELTGCKLHDFV